MKHPKNETNCTALKKLKCFKVDNVTVCRCILKRNRTHDKLIHSNCTKGYVRRCKVDKFTGKQKCRCVKMGPVLPVHRNEDIVCEEGKVKVCKRNGFCLCKKKKPVTKEPVIDPNAVGLF